MTDYHLAQLNIAKMKYQIDQPQMAEFVDKLDSINALADESPGFIWRLQTDEGDATAIDFFGSDVLVNMSVWQDLESLHHYVYRSAHNKIMSKRKRWFDRLEQVYSVLWWLPAGHIPTLPEAAAKLSLLQQNGPSAAVFTFKQSYSAPDKTE